MDLPPNVGLVFKPGFVPTAITNSLMRLLSSVATIYVAVPADRVNWSSDWTYMAPEQMMKTCDFIISVGGDGTMLGVMRDAATFQDDNEPKLIGLNMGTLGFITDVELNDDALGAGQILVSMLQGKYSTETRRTLQISLDKQTRHIAANDILLQRAAGRLLDFAVYFDGRFAYECRADGLLISTPTGSTAYSLAAGGPIVEATARVVVVTPLMPQNLSSRPIVVNDETRIDVVLTGTEQVTLYVDGNEKPQHDTIFRICHGPEIKYAYPSTTKNENRDFTKALRTKLGWNRKL